MALITVISLAIWLYLFFAHGQFWSSTPELRPTLPDQAPNVDIVVPARDEAETIGAVVASLLAQQYAGRYRVLLVDDGSTDGTADIARATASRGASDNAAFQVISAPPKPPGWSGKLWAVSQGVAGGGSPIILLTDADIVHDPRHLATLVARLNAPHADLVSEMVRLNCTSPAERWLVPAFVYFFQMLYPFARVNDPGSTVAAAAGGTILIRRGALERIGGLASIKGALIDDVTLAKAVKPGAAIYLGHSGLAASIRRYPAVGDLWNMIARTAFTQLRYSAAWLMATLVGLTLVWWAPVALAIQGRGWERACGVSACILGSVSFIPTLRRYRLNPLRSLALPLIALFYMAATLASALTHWGGQGSRWKNRDYGGDT